MKSILLSLVFASLALLAHAQRFDEWFRQKKTQIKYLEKQIAGLQIYIQLAKKGYSVTQDGLGLISAVKDGELHLHSLYFERLLKISSHIQSVFRYTGPCQEEFAHLLEPGYYRMRDDERILRLMELTNNCK